MYKVCKECNQNLPLDDFYQRANGTYESQCKECRRKKQRARNKTKKHLAKNVGDKVCKKCGEKKPLEMFHVNSTYKDGRVNICKECTNPRRKEEQRIKDGGFWVDDVNINQINQDEIEDFNRTLISLSELPRSGSINVLKYLIK